MFVDKKNTNNIYYFMIKEDMCSSDIISFAIEAHSSTNHLYAVHLAMVASYGYKYIDCIPIQNQQTVLSACWLHDTIEDCRLTYNDIKNVAGEEVAEIVYALTNDKGKNRKQRAGEVYYEGIISTPFAKYVKLCDRLANVKYSSESKSRMFELYQKENDNFFNSLFPDGVEYYYKDPVEELKSMLN